MFPLSAAIGVAIGIYGMQLIRNICTNPKFKVTKEHRAGGILKNHAEGEKYSQHFVRKYVRGKSPQIMPSVNGFYLKPNLPTSYEPNSTIRFLFRTELLLLSDLKGY